MPKAVSRKSRPQALRTAPNPPPPAPSTNKTSSDGPTTSSDSGPLSSRSSNIVPFSAATSKSSTITPKADSYLDLELEGESSGAVPVYDSCLQVRLKLKALLGKQNDRASNAQPGAFLKNGTPKPWTAKALCKAIGVTTSSYGKFMKKTGHMGGAENGTYYGAYVFLEKKRLFEGGKKSAARVKMEQEWPGGLILHDPNNIHMKIRVGDDPRDKIPKLYGGRVPASVWSKRR